MPTSMPTASPRLAGGLQVGAQFPGVRRVTIVRVNSCLICPSLSFTCLSIWLLMHLENTRKCLLCVPLFSAPYKYYPLPPASLMTGELSWPLFYRRRGHWAERLLLSAWYSHNWSTGGLASGLVHNQCCLKPVLTARTQSP